MAILLLLWTGQHAAAQSALSTIPQQAETNGQNRVVTKSNNVTNSAMNKVDSASDKAFKSFTGLFKKKKKKPADSTAVPAAHAPDTTSVLPRPSSFNRSPYDRHEGLPFVYTPVPDRKNYYFKHTIIETYQS
jgi:hypothetical protein